MTKRREPLTYHHALTVIASRIGWDSCGAICGVGDRTVRYWSDPDCETEIRLIDAERLDRAFLSAGGDYAPFHRLHAQRIDLAGRDLSQVSLTAKAAIVAKETGEAVSALIHASGSTDPETLRRARVEAEEAINSLMDGVAVLNRVAEAQA